MLKRDAVHGGIIGVQHPDVLRWLGNLTSSSATAYDKAMDAVYNSTHIGGGNHRMFDGGHDLIGAWHAIKGAVPDASIGGYIHALWKDVTTVKGLPFFTWDKEDYDRISEWLTHRAVGVTKDWVYDLFSYDALEFLASGLSSVAFIAAVRADNVSEYSEILGSTTSSAIMSANLLSGFLVIGAFTYLKVYVGKKILWVPFTYGFILAAIVGSILLVLDLPILVEAALAVALLYILRRIYSYLKEAYYESRSN